MTTYGVGIAGPYAVLPELAKQAEAHGFETVWMPETTQNSIVQATVVVSATSRINVGTNITLAFPRSPTVAATAAWDLDELSGGRFILGLGSQVKRIIEDRFSSPFDPPAKRMAEYLQAVKAVLKTARGDETTFEGDYYRILLPGFHGETHPERRMPPVMVAAVGPLMIKAAATYADGILGHPFTSPRYLREVIAPRVDESLAKAGRDRADFTLCSGVILSISDDRELAIREAKQQIGFYGTTPNYKGVFDIEGDGHLTAQLRAAWKTKSLDALVDAVPDSAVEKYAVAGTPDEVRDKVAAFAEVADHLVIGGPWYKVPVGRLFENFTAALETFGRAA